MALLVDSDLIEKIGTIKSISRNCQICLSLVHLNEPIDQKYDNDIL